MGLLAMPCVFALGAYFGRGVPSSIEELVFIAMCVVTVCAQAVFASTPIANGLAAMAHELPDIVKHAIAEMTEKLQTHISSALTPIVASTPLEYATDMLAFVLSNVLKKCIIVVAKQLNVRKMTPGCLGNHGQLAALLGTFLFAALLVWVLPVLTNFVQFHAGVFFICVCLLHAGFIVLALNAHRLVAIALSLAESIYNSMFQFLLTGLLDDENLDSVIQSCSNPVQTTVAGAGSFWGYLFSSSDDGGAQEDEASQTRASTEDASPVEERAGEDAAGAEGVGPPGKPPISMAALKLMLQEATRLEFSMHKCDAAKASDEAAHAELVGTLTSRLPSTLEVTPNVM
jgi:hypothetical protein